MTFKQILGLHVMITVAKVLYPLWNWTFVEEVVLWLHF